MRYSVQGQQIGSDSLTCRDMNFGQGCPGLAPMQYEIRITWSDFIRELQGIYAKFLSEVIADEPYDEGDVDEINELRALGWPSIERLASRDGSLLLRVVKRFLATDVLNHLLPTHLSQLKAPAYMIDSVDAVREDCVEILIAGRAYPFDVRPFAKS